MTSAARMLTALAAGVALALTGCGSPADDAADDAAGPVSSAPSAAGTAAGPTAEPSQGARGRFTEMTVEVVATGAGCTYVTDPGAERWALRGPVPDVAAGQRLVVRGGPDDTPYEDCPDGLPFLVTSVEPAVR